MKEEIKKTLKKDLLDAATVYKKKKEPFEETMKYSDCARVDPYNFLYCQALFDLAIDFYQIKKDEGISFPEDSFATLIMQAIDQDGEINDNFLADYEKLGSLKNENFLITQRKFERLFGKANFKKADEAFIPIGGVIDSKAMSMVIEDKLPEDIKLIYIYAPGAVAVDTTDGKTFSYEGYATWNAVGKVTDEIETDIEQSK